LGKLVFNDKKQMTKLNKIMIPLIQKKLAELKTKNELIFVELAIYLNHMKKFQKYFSKVIYISVEKELEKINLQKKFSHLRFFPTNNVGNLKNPINNTRLQCCFFVENHQNKTYLKKQILKILKNFKK
jgi:dephospho-CoA kinase